MADEAGRESLGLALRSRWVKFLAAAACAVLLGYLVYFVRSTLAPFVLAAVAAYILNPAVEFLQAKLRLPRGVVVAALMVVLTAAVVGTLALGISYLVRTVERVVPQAELALYPDAQPNTFAERVHHALESIPTELRVQVKEMLEHLPRTLRDNFRDISASLLQGFGAVFGALLSLVVASFKFVLFFVVMGYLLADLPALRAGAGELIPARHKEAVLRVLGHIDTNIRAFYRGQFLVSLALCGIYSAGLLACGVDFAVLIGVAGGMADMVPYLGLVVGMLPALAFALVPYGGLLKPLGVVLVFAFGQTLAGMYLSPRIVGRRVGLHPVAVLLAIMVFGHLLGFLGVIFAVPLAAVIRVLLGEWVAHYKRNHS